MGPREVNLLASTQLGRGGVKIQTVPESLESPKPVGGKIASPNSSGARDGRQRWDHAVGRASNATLIHLDRKPF